MLQSAALGEFVRLVRTMARTEDEGVERILRVYVQISKIGVAVRVHLNSASGLDRDWDFLDFRLGRGFVRLAAGRCQSSKQQRNQYS